MIEAVGLCFSYKNGPELFNRLSVSFAPGETVALTGGSGRGKSTLLYILGQMLRPKSGQIRLQGAEVSSLRDSRLAHLRATKYGFIFQDAALDPARTVVDNVVEGALYRGVPRKSVLREAQSLLREFGVNLQASAKPGQVSGGQAQRIALCRALLADPPVLLADEPTGNLDPVSSNVVIDALEKRARKGAVVVVATHDPFVISRCDREVKL